MPEKQYITKSADQVLQEWHITVAGGLSADEVKQRLARFGPNELSGEITRWWKILFRQFTSPFIYLLIGATALAFILHEVIDGIMILIFVLINAVLGFYQEFRSEKALHLLKQFVTRRARVVRQGAEVIIPAAEVVPGDIIIVEPGDLISADLRLVQAENLTIDESVLTGESVPVNKQTGALTKKNIELFEASNMGFSGTTVMTGKGVGVVIATGKQTEIGRIAKMASLARHESTFEKGISRFSKFILRLIVATLIIVFIANLIIKGEKADLIEMIIFSIALAVSVIPEALPMVTTFSLSRGALHLAKHHMVVKRLSAIEDLGSIEILCTDKTGTLTENVLTVDREMPVAGASPLFCASLASPFIKENKKEPNNSFDLAIFKKLPKTELKKLEQYRIIEEWPFDPDRRRNSVIVEKGGDAEIVVRGALEIILPLCGNQAQGTLVAQWASEAGKAGRRVLAVARRKLGSSGKYDITKEEKSLELVGLLTFIDPLKKSTLRAIEKAKQMKIQIKILTGDSAEVAGAVAHQIGLVQNQTDVLSGQELEALAPAEQSAAVEKFHVFARVSPEQKFNIIKLLESKNEVGFLGEGINDSPALKAANVGLVVDEASDIARETADIVLLNRSLNVIIDGIEQGRLVFANTTKYIRATLTSNFGNFFAVATASLLIDFLPMLPLQILLLNLLSDFPMIAIAADTVDRDELKKPRHYQVRDIVLMATFLGLVSTLFDFLCFGLFYKMSPAILQTNWFIASILTELVLLFSIRTRFAFYRATKPAAIVIWLTAIAAVVTLTVPYLPFAQEVFKFIKPTGQHLLIIFSLVGIYFICTEAVKRLYYRYVRAAA